MQYRTPLFSVQKKNNIYCSSILQGGLGAGGREGGEGKKETIQETKDMQARIYRSRNYDRMKVVGYELDLLIAIELSPQRTNLHRIL